VDALISGQAEVAVLIEPDSMRRFHVDDPETLVPCARSDVPYLFANVDDVVRLSATTHDAARRELERLWQQDRGMHLLLILLDREEEQDTRREAAECLEDLLGIEAVEAVETFLGDRLYARPLPAQGDPAAACRLARAANAGRVVRFVEDLDSNQPYVLDRRTAWDSLPQGLFACAADKRAFDDLLIARGYFRRAALAGEDRSRVDAVWVELLADRALARLPDHRRVLLAWKENLVLVRATQRREVQPEPSGDPSAESRRPKKVRPGHEILDRIERQKKAIEALLTRGKRSQALRFAAQLVKYQEKNSTPEQIAKTLCDLARRAAQCGCPEEQLSFASQAVEWAPFDPQTHNHYAEALVSLGRSEEALRAYDETMERFPDNVVARNGRAEVLKALGRSEEALRAYDETMERFPDNVVARTGRAEVLKELGRFDEALLAYRDTTATFPHNRVARNGLASTLVLMSRHEEARAMLGTPEPVCLADWIDLHVRGMIFLKEGNLEEAVAIFQKGLDCPFPRQRAYFRTALAIAKLRAKEYEAAARLASEDRLAGTLSAVIRLHAYGELHDEEKAAAAYADTLKSRNPTAARLREELGARYVLRPPDHVWQSDDWVFEQECFLALAA